ncbi:hypothetical protein LCGC14_1314750, partial [marine sediment metagenome]
ELLVLKYFRKPKDRLEMCVFDEQKKEILKFFFNSIQKI